MLSPSKKQYINIHTHHLPVSGDVFIINNVYAQDIQRGFFTSRSAFSIGLHPYHILYVKIEESLLNVETMAGKPAVMAIGEAGIDRTIDTSFDLQKQVFIRQINISERVEKPMIVHCREAVEDIVQIRKETDAIESWIVHGFDGTPEQAQILLHHDFYLSFGEELLKHDSPAIETFKMIPEHCFFLESDNTTEFTIFDVYQRAAELRNISIDELRMQIYLNFRRCFFNEE